MSKTKYTQCLLEKNNRQKTTYIPEKFAKKGQIVKLRGEDNIWSDGWLVTEVYTTEDECPDYRKAIRWHRNNTGDSLPKIHNEEK